ncbi:MAG: GNAT family N-acetyltransferase [Verrucomicrobiota bacterium]
MAVQHLSIGLLSRLPNGVSLERIDPLSGDRWDKDIINHPNLTIFHRSAWARVLNETYGHQPYYLKFISSEGSQTWVPLMEVDSRLTGRRGVCLPFADFAGPLWSSAVDPESVYQSLQQFAKEQKWKRLDIRHTEVSPHGAQPFISYDGHVLDLRQREDELERRLDTAVRRAIRKAARAGLEISIKTDAESTAAFYQLHCQTRRRHGLPPQPFRFFSSIQRNLLSQGLGEIVLATLHGKPIAGAVFLRSAGRAIYKFGASDPAHWETRPNQWVMWHGIKHLIANGCSELHFGRTSRGDEGLSRFKRSWGCESSELNYFRHDIRRNCWLSGAQSNSESHPLLFGWLPLALNRIAGQLIYPHLD